MGEVGQMGWLGTMELSVGLKLGEAGLEMMQEIVVFNNEKD